MGDDMRGTKVTTDPLEGLIRQAQGGNREAFATTIAIAEERLKSVISRRMGPELRSKVEPDDIFQEVITQAFASLDRFAWQGEGSYLRWLRGIAENVLLGAADKHKRRAILEVEARRDLSSQVSASRGLRREERFERLEKALQSLSTDHREVILLARIEGLQMDEIAERLGRSKSAVKNLLLRALKELKRSFGDTESFHLPARSLGWERGRHDE
jgi:RNA polymerase sigma-70 factor (ECF subfamily)